MRKMITKGTKLFVLLLTVLLVFSSKLIIYAESETFYNYEENHIQNQGLDYYNNTSRFYSEFRIVNGVANLYNSNQEGFFDLYLGYRNLQ